jgi:transposase-like protein
MSVSESALQMFKGRHFDQEVIVVCVQWYLSYKLSSRDLVELMSERWIALAHTTILRWVQRYVPVFEKQWSRYARPVGRSRRCDETYIKVKGRWTYLYRAVDKQGRTVDFLLSERRDVAAAKRFFRKAIKSHPTPRVITLDSYAALHRAVSELKSPGTMPHRVEIRASKYLNIMLWSRTIVASNTGFDRCSDSNDSRRQPSRSAASSLQGRFGNISSRQKL